MPEEKPVSSAFAKPPRQADRFRERYEQSEAGQLARQLKDDPMNRPYQPPVQPQLMENFQPPQQEQAPQPQYQQPQYQPPQPQPAPAPQSQDGVDPTQYQQLLAEREAMRQQLEQQNAYIQQIQEERQKAADASFQDDFAKRIAENPLLNDLETTEPSDAQRIAAMTAAALSEPIKRIQGELAQQRAAQAQAYQQMVEQQKVQELLRTHPDFPQLAKSDPNFISYMKSRDGYSSRTREEMAMDEFQRGNVAYLSDMISRYKSGVPNAQQISSVPPVQVAGGSAYMNQRSTKPSVGYTLREINDLYQMKRINHDQYRVMLNDWRAANPQ